MNAISFTQKPGATEYRCPICQGNLSLDEYDFYDYRKDYWACNNLSINKHNFSFEIMKGMENISSLRFYVMRNGMLYDANLIFDDARAYLCILHEGRALVRENIFDFDFSTVNSLEDFLSFMDTLLLFS